MLGRGVGSLTSTEVKVLVVGWVWPIGEGWIALAIGFGLATGVLVGLAIGWEKGSVGEEGSGMAIGWRRGLDFVVVAKWRLDFVVAAMLSGEVVVVTQRETVTSWGRCWVCDVCWTRKGCCLPP